MKNRKEFGHWELDTVVSSRGKSKGCFCELCRTKKPYIYDVIKLAKCIYRYIKTPLLHTISCEEEASLYNDRNSFPLNLMTLIYIRLFRSAKLAKQPLLLPLRRNNCVEFPMPELFSILHRFGGVLRWECRY